MQNPTIENFGNRARPDGIIEAVWTENGKRRRRSTRTRSKAEAKDILRQIERDVRAPHIPTHPTIGWILDQYEADRELAGKPSIGQLRASINPVRRLMGHLRWDQINQSDIDCYARQRLQERDPRQGHGCKTIAPSTADKDLRILRAALKFAFSAKLVPAKYEFKINLPATPPKDVWLTKAEVNKMLERCELGRTDVGNRRTDRNHLAGFLLISTATAARKEAVLTLKWDQVYIPDGLALNYDKQSVIEGAYIDFGEGNGNKRRPTMPIGQNWKLMNWLIFNRPQDQAQVPPEDRYESDDYVINFAGGKIADIKKVFATVLAEAGIPKKATPHTLKHSTITWMVQGGMQFSEISDLTNTSVKVLRKYYSHHRPDYQAVVGTTLSL